MKQSFKGETLTMRKCINSIMRFYNEATPLEVQEGLNWYREANTYTRELSSRFGLSLSQTAGIISVFSPQAAWSENKMFAVRFLLNSKNRVKSLVQTLKARRIKTLKTEDEIYNALSITGKAWKTKAFFLNICNHDIPTSVTIDRHAIAACIQHPTKVEALDKNFGKLTKSQYEFFEAAYIHAANEVGLMPHQLQSLVWTVYRRFRELGQYTNEENYF